MSLSSELQRKMPATYDKSEVRFLYPDNWSLSEDQEEQWPQAISVQSPSSAFWSLHVYPSRQDSGILAKEALRGLSEAYEEVESEEVFEKIGPAEATGYNAEFFYLDFVVRAEVRSFAVAGRSFVVLCQAESREFEEMAKVFRAITLSLLQP